jgi:putative holliday junction resolvase
VRLLGLDIGERRIGVAVCDPGGRVATPVTVLDARRLAADLAPLLRLASDYEAEGLVVGLPLTMGGEEGPQARSVRETAERLATGVGLPLFFVDERLTSVQAERSMASAGADARSRRGSVDMVAAALLLQSYLDAAASIDTTETDAR